MDGQTESTVGQASVGYSQTAERHALPWDCKANRILPYARRERLMCHKLDVTLSKLITRRAPVTFIGYPIYYGACIS